jgi:hypothetical protein
LAPVLKKKFAPDLSFNDFPYTVEADNTHVMHLFGSMYGVVWADALFQEGIDAMDVDGKIMLLSRFVPPDDRFPIPTIESLTKVLRENIRRLEDALGSGAYFYDLPVDCQIEDHMQNMDIRGFVDFLASLRLVRVEMELFRQYGESLR